MNFNEYIQLDTSSNSITFKHFKKGNNEILIKLNNNIIKEIKLRQSFIQFFTCSEELSNPLVAEFHINIYLNNHIITLEVTGENKKEIKNFCDYIKSVLI